MFIFEDLIKKQREELKNLEAKIKEEADSEKFTGGNSHEEISQKYDEQIKGVQALSAIDDEAKAKIIKNLEAAKSQTLENFEAKKKAAEEHKNRMYLEFWNSVISDLEASVILERNWIELEESKCNNLIQDITNQMTDAAAAGNLSKIDELTKMVEEIQKYLSKLEKNTINSLENSLSIDTKILDMDSIRKLVTGIQEEMLKYKQVEPLDKSKFKLEPAVVEIKSVEPVISEEAKKVEEINRLLDEAISSLENNNEVLKINEKTINDIENKINSLKGPEYSVSMIENLRQRLQELKDKYNQKQNESASRDDDFVIADFFRKKEEKESFEFKNFISVLDEVHIKIMNGIATSDDIAKLDELFSKLGISKQITGQSKLDIIKEEYSKMVENNKKAAPKVTNEKTQNNPENSTYSETIAKLESSILNATTVLELNRIKKSLADVEDKDTREYYEKLLDEKRNELSKKTTDVNKLLAEMKQTISSITGDYNDFSAISMDGRSININTYDHYKETMKEYAEKIIAFRPNINEEDKEQVILYNKLVSKYFSLKQLFVRYENVDKYRIQNGEIGYKFRGKNKIKTLKNERLKEKLRNKETRILFANSKSLLKAENLLSELNARLRVNGASNIGKESRKAYNNVKKIIAKNLYKELKEQSQTLDVHAACDGWIRLISIMPESFTLRGDIINKGIVIDYFKKYLNMALNTNISRKKMQKEEYDKYMNIIVSICQYRDLEDDFYDFKDNGDTTKVEEDVFYMDTDTILDGITYISPEAIVDNYIKAKSK